MLSCECLKFGFHQGICKMYINEKHNQQKQANKCIHGHTDMQLHIHIHIHMHTHIHVHTDRQTDKHTDKHTNALAHVHITDVSTDNIIYMITLHYTVGNSHFSKCLHVFKCVRLYCSDAVKIKVDVKRSFHFGERILINYFYFIVPSRTIKNSFTSHYITR